MKNISDAADLMATARDALLNELLPALPKDRRYAGLMIANAMTIATREHRTGRDATRGEAQRLSELLADAGVEIPPSPPVGSGDLSALRRIVSGAIRRGVFDDPLRQRMLRAHMAQTAADWVAISNPKALRAPS